MKYTLYYILTILIFVSCESDPPTCAITLKELEETSGSKILKVPASGAINDYRDKGRDSTIGGYYSFYKNGNIKEYSFFRDSNLVNYKEQFDSIGYLAYQYGTPLVYREAELIGDSLELRFYFFSLNKKIESILLFHNSKDSISLSATDDSLFSNMQVAKYLYKDLDDEKDIRGYLQVKFVNVCTGAEKQLVDSIKLHYKPNE
ncbi:hypothetical protein [Paraflavitalea speifideaquila]|uniref:hypothetical protein n=1 Tax=Paraflavitalea speifideaquila TaxID=3076558 RepID=UPI0028E1AD1D|nr:hypothetical protein [Paraflavitalea speifideiaquila]